MKTIPLYLLTVYNHVLPDGTTWQHTWTNPGAKPAGPGWARVEDQFDAWGQKRVLWSRPTSEVKPS